MNSSEFKGFSSVFKFTLTQTLKQKSYIVTLIIMVMFSVGVFPVLKLVNMTDEADTGISSVLDDEDSEGDSDEEMEDILETIHTVSVINDTNLTSIPFDNMVESYGLPKNLIFEESDDEVEEACRKLDEGAKSKEEKAMNKVLVHANLDMEKWEYDFRVFYSEASSVDEDDAQLLADNLALWFSGYKEDSVGVTQETLDNISAEVTSKVVKYDDFIEHDELRVISQNEYNVVYAALMLFYMIIIFSASMVSNKIVEEKANRIVEYLMTTVRPLALMMGKIIAMLIAGVGEFVVILLSGFASYKVCEEIWPPSEESIMSGFLSLDGIKELGAVNITVCIVIMAIGVFMYSLIASLFAASVTKMEEVQQGLKIFTMIILVAFFASMIATNLMWSHGINLYVKVIMYIPITSVMILPGVILIGEAGLIEILVSVAIMIATTIFLLWFVSLIYESVIVTNGSVVSFKTMMSMAKDSLSKKKGGVSHEK